MRGNPQAASTRWRATTAPSRWTSWIGRLRQVQRRCPEDRLEVIERMRREEWRALRSGEHVPEPGWQRRWR